MQKFSTSEAAKALRILRPNLQRLIRESKVKAPPLTRVGGVRVRLWSKSDIEKARKAIRKK